MKKAREMTSLPLYMEFPDYKKTFVSVQYKNYMENTHGVGLCLPTVDTILKLYKGQQATIRVDKDKTAASSSQLNATATQNI